MKAIASTEERVQLERNLIDIAIRKINVSVLASLLLDTLIVIALWSLIEQSRLLTWFGVAAVVMVLHVVYVRRYLRLGSSANAATDKWKLGLIAGSAAAGLCWSSTVFYFPSNPFDSLTILGEFVLPSTPFDPVIVLLLFILAGVSAYHSVVMASVPSAVNAFLICVWIPQMLWLFSFGEKLYVVMGLIAASYLGAMLMASRRMYSTMCNLYLTGEKNKELAVALARAEQVEFAKAQKENDRRNSELFANFEDIIFFVDVAEEGGFTVASINPAAERAFGIKSEEVCGKRKSDLFPAALAARLEAYDQACVDRGQAVHYEEVLEHPSGNRYFGITHIPMFDAAGKIIQIAVISRDITESKQYEERLLKSEAQFRLLAENAPDPIYRYDRDCRRIYINPAVERLTGTPAAALLNKSPTEAMPVASANALQAQQSIQRVLDTGKPGELEISFVTADGRECTVLNTFVPEFTADGSVGTVLCVGRDISTRKHIEKILLDSEREYRALAENIPANIIRYDRECRIRYVNKNVEDIFGIPLTYVLGKTPAEVFSDGLFDELELVLQGVIETGKAIDYDIILPDNGKGEQYHRMNITPERNERGEVIGVLNVGRDITEQKRYEQELLARAKLEQRLSTLTENVPGFVFTIRVDTNGHTSFPYASEGIEQLFGLRAEDVREDAAVLRAKYHPDDLPRIHALMQETERTLAPFRIEIRITNRDNQQIWIEIRSMPQRQPDGATEWHGVMLDITERKRMENELQRASDFQQSLLSGMREAGIILVVVENERFVYTNDHYVGCKLGYAEGQLPATVSFINLIHPDDRPRVAEMHRDRQVGKPVPSSYEIGALAGDGSRLDYEFHVTLVPDSNPPQTLLLALDIGKRKRMEQALIAREQEFRSLAENLPDNIARWDVEGRIIHSNSIHQRTLGRPASELIGKTHRESFPDGRYDPVDAGIAQVIATGQAALYVRQPVSFENGETEIHDVKLVPERDDGGKIISVLGVGRNLTDLYRLQDDLQAREKQLRALAESSPGMMGAFYARPDGSFCVPYVSPNIVELFGIHPQDVAHDASAMMALCHPDDAQHVEESIAESARTMTTWHEEYRILHPTLGERWMESNTHPQPHPDGGIVWYGYIHDITVRKEAEQPRTKLARALKLLSESSMLLVQAKNEQELLEETCRLTVATGGYRLAWVGLAENDEHKTVRPVAQCGFEDGYLDGINVTWADTERGQGPIGITIRTGVATINDDFHTNPTLALWREGAIKRGYRSSIALPMVGNGQVLGMLAVYSAEAHAFSNNEEVALLQELADNLALGIWIQRTSAAQARMAVELAAREQEFRTLAENSPDPIYRYDRDCRRIYVNPAVGRIIGKPLEALIGSTPGDGAILVSGQNKKLMESIRSVFASGETENINLEFVAQDGEHHDYFMVLVPERDVAGQVVTVLAIARDVTEIKKAQQLTSRFMNNMPGFAYSFRITPDGRASFPFCSRGIEDIYGLTPEEVRDDMAPLHALQHPEDRPRTEAAMAESARTMSPFWVEVRIQRPGHPERWIECRAIPEKEPDGSILWQGVMLDINERKRMENVLQRNQEMLTDAQKLAQLGSWSWDVVANRVEWSEMACEIYTPDTRPTEPVFEDFKSSLHPEDLEKVLAAIQSTFDLDTPYDLDHRVVSVSKGIRTVHAQGKLFRDANGKPIRMVGTVQDISERKRMEDVLKFIAQGEWLSRDEDFLTALASYLGKMLGLDYVIVDKLASDPAYAETVAIYAKGSVVPNMQYSLQYTPCENVMNSGLCCYPENVQQRFPKDSLLVDMQVESYTGIPLWDSKGNVIGLIALMDGKPMTDTNLLTSMLQLVATSAAAALEQMQADARLKEKFERIVELNNQLEINARDLEDQAAEFEAQAVELEASQEQIMQTEAWYRNIVRSAPDGMVVVNENGLISLVNANIEKMFGYAEGELIGHSIEMLLPPDTRQGHVAKRDGFFASGYMGRPMDVIISALRACRKDGSEFPVYVSLSRLPDMDGRVGVICAAIRDVTEHKRLEDALAARELESRTLLDNSPDNISRYNRECRRTFVNQAYAAIVDGGVAALLGKTPTECPGGPNADLYENKIREVFESGINADFELRWTNKDERDICSHVRLTAERDAAGNVVSVLTVGRDITELNEHRKRVYQMAFYDSLTSLPNRALFNDRLRQMITDASWHEQLAGVMLLDLDRFKAVNDSLGHPAGDELLRETAARLTYCVRGYDTVARLGGDEFAILLPEIRSGDDLGRVSSKILESFNEPFLLEGKEVFISCSIGISVFPVDSEDGDDLLKHADSAMYFSKRSGRNTFRFYSKDLTVISNERLLLEGDLRRGFGRGELELYFQPKVSLSNGALIGSEALLRWNHPQRGVVSPDKFISIAEDCGLIVEIGEWVLREACRVACEWNEQGKPLHKVAINLSARQFQSRDLVSSVRRALDDSHCRPQWIELEITESLLLDEDGEVLEVLETFREMGITIAIDDFGTGYSSLSYLARFPIDTLKIDRSFTSRVTDTGHHSELVKAIISIAHSLKQKVVAEGVETVEQAAILQAYGCHVAQGYLYSTPVQKAVFEALPRSFGLEAVE